MKAIVLFSGGIDSSVCLAAALAEFGSENVLALTFDYGQGHIRELDAAKKIAQDWKVHQKIININFVKDVVTSALIDSTIPINGTEAGLLNVVVPGRNGLFLRIAGMLSVKTKVSDIYIGINEMDYPDFPDCSRSYMDLMENIMRIDFNNRDIKIITPISQMTKKEILNYAKKLGVVEYILENTITCYRGISKMGCGNCLSCQIRNNAIKDFLKENQNVNISYGTEDSSEN